MFLFDTSAIADDATITGGTLSLYGGTEDGDGGSFGSPTICLVASTPASNTSLAVGDYDQFGTTELATRLTTWATKAYNAFTLNASGLAAISLSSISKFGTRVGPDVDDAPPTWQSGRRMSRSGSFAEDSGTTKDPKLAVTYTLPTPPTSIFLPLLGVG
jgi:hypothetical protein